MKHLRKQRCLFALAAGFLFLHAVCLYVTRLDVLVTSDIFENSAALLAFGACVWRASRERGTIRLAWGFFSAGLFLWSTAMLMASWKYFFHQLPSGVAYVWDFLFLLYGVPIMLAISMPIGDEQPYSFPWLDGLQAVITSCVVYVYLFSGLPFLAGHGESLPASALADITRAMNLLLTVAATLRLLTLPAQGKVQYFYAALTVFLGSYLLSDLTYYHVVLLKQDHAAYADLLVPLPFLCATVYALSVPQQRADRTAPRRGSMLAIFIDNASPMLYTAGLLALGIFVSKRHFYWGCLSVAVAVGVYAVRSTLLQTQIMRTKDALRIANEQLETLSLTDGLTGIPNRRCFDRELELELGRARRSRYSLSLLMIDVDHFKSLNDQYGHRRGDDCLIRVARALRSTLIRESDLLARYGGEEFVLILADAERGGAETVAKRMQAAIRELNIVNKTPNGERVTISIGITTCSMALQTCLAGGLVEAADRALYHAKENGRDRIEFFALDDESAVMQ